MLLQSIFHDCELTVTRHEPVHGGDINSAWCLHTDTGKYFLKVNDAQRYRHMFEKEANGLIALKNNCSLTIPLVLKHGIAGNDQYLLLEWIEKGAPKPDCQQQLGTGLAMLHKKPQLWFGWEEDNYIGSLPQSNTKHNNWHSFYGECRIMPLAEQLFRQGSFTKQEVVNTESLCKKLDQLFPSEPASLLHGDLWSGNYMVATNGYAALFDPAVYCGHREMDIGMTLLFGGFSETFYRSYIDTYPLDQNWQRRVPLTQLYPLLVHAALFGGHYVHSAANIIQRYS
jgi:fructosamine-3-kinase